MSKTVRVVLAGALLLALSAGMAAAQVSTEDRIECNRGAPERCEGSSGHDTITGSSNADDIYARGGDFVNARGGRDLVLGGGGDDDPGSRGGLDGGAGNDTVKGQDGADTVTDDARRDADRLEGNTGNDFVDGRDGDGRDTINCGAGRDTFDKDRGDTKRNCENRRL